MSESHGQVYWRPYLYSICISPLLNTLFFLLNVLKQDGNEKNSWPLWIMKKLHLLFSNITNVQFLHISVFFLLCFLLLQASLTYLSDKSFYIHTPPGGSLQSLTSSSERYTQVHLTLIEHYVKMLKTVLLVTCRPAMRATVTSWSSCVLPVKSWWEPMNRSATTRENVQRGRSTANTAKNLSC